MNFKCNFSAYCSCSCSKCFLFENCSVCTRASECDRRNTENSCKFDDNPFIKALFRQEKAFDLIEEDDELSY